MNLLAIDLGATSGRVSLARFDGTRLTIDETHRFPNDPVSIGPRLHWDVLRLLYEIKQGVRAGTARAETIDCIGIDSWGLDFGLLDRNGELMGNPYHYRDQRAVDVMPAVWARVPKPEIYAQTAIQFMPLNSLYQLAAIAADGSPNMAHAAMLLQIPDLMRFWLTGEHGSEYTNATTTQFIDIETGDWARGLLDRLEIPHHMLQPIVHGPILAGALRPSVQAELGLDEPVPMAIVGQHDTASAVAAVPAMSASFAYLSCGTLALIGTTVPEPISGPGAFAWNMTNEGGLFGDYRFLKNMMGTWQLERCRAAWGAGLSAADVQSLAEAARPFTAFLDPDADAFFHPADMPDAIRGWLANHGERMPNDRGEMARIIYESIALKTAFVLERIETLANRRFSGLHVVGGGAKSGLLCQLIASAICRPVWAGPVEATTLGNAAAQLLALGRIADAAELREVVRSSAEVVSYEPDDTDAWQEAREHFRLLIDRVSRQQREERA